MTFYAIPQDDCAITKHKRKVCCIDPIGLVIIIWSWLVFESLLTS